MERDTANKHESSEKDWTIIETMRCEKHAGGEKRGSKVSSKNEKQ